MRYRVLGQSGIQVSRMGLGTLTWGRDVDSRQAGKLLRTFFDGGGNLIDTAAAYGAAETMIGRFLVGVDRDDVVIATKAGLRADQGAQRIDTSKKAMLEDLHGSLKRLNVDYVDLWQVHAWGSTPVEETLAALDYAVASGAARAVGVSNFVGWQTGQAVTWQRCSPERVPISATQFEYSLLARRAEYEVIPAAQEYAMGCLAWSPLGRGVLSGQYLAGIPKASRGASEHLSWFVEPYLDEASTRIVRGVSRAARGLDFTSAQIAWLWVRDAPGVTAPIVGVRTVEQLAELLAVENAVLPREIVDALDDISGGPAPGRLEE